MRISIVGAYGFTGKIICEEFNKIKYSYSIYGRNINNRTLLLSEHYSQNCMSKHHWTFKINI